MTTLAGKPNQPGSTDGTAAEALFRNPTGIAVDPTGNVYVVDTGNHTIRRISPGGVVTTVAGTAGEKGSTDGSRVAARLDPPRKVAVGPAGVLYVLSETAVRKVAPDGTVSTLPIGNRPTSGATILTGIAVAANGDLFIVDSERQFSAFGGSQGSVIRKFNPQGEALAFGSAADGKFSFFFANDLAIDAAGNLYAVQNGLFTTSSIGQTFRAILRIAPDGTATALSGGGKPSAEMPSTVDGDSKATRFADPRALSVGPDGWIAVVETASHAVRMVDPQGRSSTLAGGNGAGSIDGAAAVARFDGPEALAATSDGTLYVLERNTSKVRNVTPSGVVGTLPWSGFTDLEQLATGPGDSVYVSQWTGATFRIFSLYRFSPGPGDGSPTRESGARSGLFAVDPAANVIYPHSQGITLTAPDGSSRVLVSGVDVKAVASNEVGVVYFVTSDGTLSVINAAGEVRVVANTAAQLPQQVGVGAAFRFQSPAVLTLDSAGNVYVAGARRVVKVTPGGVVTTVINLTGLEGVDPTGLIRGIAWSRGALYVSILNAIVKIAPVR